MDASLCRGLPVLMAAIAAFISLDCIGAPVAADGPFARIPPLTTACYRQGDQFESRLEAVKEAVAKEKEKQDAINAQIEEAYGQLDPMEMSARMTQWMMDNPQEAQKYVQANQAAGTSMQTESAELAAEETTYRNGLKDLVARYDAAMKQATAPAEARLAALNKRLAESGCSFGSGECSLPAYAQPELDAILRMTDEAYLAACPKWWGANGEIPTFLKQRRDWLVNEYLPTYGQIDAIRMQQFAIMNTPAASYEATSAHQHADTYMNDVWKLYHHRPDKPYCTSVGCEGFNPAIQALSAGRP